MKNGINSEINTTMKIITNFEDNLIKFLLENKESLSNEMCKYEIDSFDRIDGLIEILKIYKTKIKE